MHEQGIESICRSQRRIKSPDKLHAKAPCDLWVEIAKAQ